MAATTMTAGERYAKAVQAARDAEERGLSMATQNRRWREVFAAEDALKASGAWR